MLKSIEGRFKCKFLHSEVSISGYAVRKSKVDYYRGSMDAVAVRLPSSPEDDLEVFVVDWKTTSKTDLADLSTWWNNATNFKNPLYQCLLYRELLQMKLKLLLKGIKAQVGIMLVPFHQSDPELLMPGLCMDVKTMDEKGLLEGLKEYRWFAKETSCVHTIKMSCNLFKKGFERYIDKSTKTLKEGACLKDIFSNNANIGMLCRELGLLKLKVEYEAEGDVTKNVRGKVAEKKIIKPANKGAKGVDQSTSEVIYTGTTTDEDKKPANSCNLTEKGCRNVSHQQQFF
ncbi:uncharacterized protein LOC144644683, partial [Oculina patagonica]